ncbi:proteasome alpha 3 subunit-like protein [Rozella allomycis CSF55]|uniref:Proteasome alpha 3 subunit-like protein n=1 Tax=Rozella allomycis (strain CSF55) TaxID=988480 RepID=A0A075APS0_ROZAC|nr:Proteasome, subunit alpha/beta domain-containing protein [Rozella allomycis CSF55]RKP20105.1 proteasome alpha 3 subunit-like protein [Rozella allomycis CSF55]|eukprot:EPZ32073.1 Proteasome, subunit alpha/beta domain-containing protein [Rozella allomycis CSF55]
MSSIGTGYDLSATTFSPDGRIFQNEYALKAVDNSGTVIGIKCKDGIVLGVEKLIHSKLLVSGSNRRIGTADYHIGIACSGLLADGRHIINRATDEAANYRNTYRDAITGNHLADRLSLYIQAHTLYSSVRPFGASAIIGVYSKNGPQLFMIEPSGLCWVQNSVLIKKGYRGCVIGKGKQNAKTMIEKIDFENITAREAAKEVAKIIYAVHDEAKDKDFELELSWICDESKKRHTFVPKDIYDECVKYAKDSLNAEMED